MSPPFEKAWSVHTAIPSYEQYARDKYAGNGWDFKQVNLWVWRKKKKSGFLGVRCFVCSTPWVCKDWALQILEPKAQIKICYIELIKDGDRGRHQVVLLLVLQFLLSVFLNHASTVQSRRNAGACFCQAIFFLERAVMSNKGIFSLYSAL